MWSRVGELLHKNHRTPVGGAASLDSTGYSPSRLWTFDNSRQSPRWRLLHFLLCSCVLWLLSHLYASFNQLYAHFTFITQQKQLLMLCGGPVGGQANEIRLPQLQAKRWGCGQIPAGAFLCWWCFLSPSNRTPARTLNNLINIPWIFSREHL